MILKDSTVIVALDQGKPQNPLMQPNMMGRHNAELAKLAGIELPADDEGQTDNKAGESAHAGEKVGPAQTVLAVVSTHVLCKLSVRPCGIPSASPLVDRTGNLSLPMQ